ncbi:ABC transporter permease [Parasphaerochaeta coccoides]|uniref:Carbohydrate ABC transporter membrane protein 1, CUT1 family n=1 Tax=Parasphaerochaeta coccoides (strain ATCC BAA-1237 / DSM 17374 / SPN1) TaxID=760011 RepID=F4GLH2_PARC1|nr:ABC transporter permease subunit [Parasphaerochaeta coccoides]AEC01942.1 carbohydrate ABC transporter membrane protein 1, CUT1 family [Parasphaerochaeta coccoides DSM 17374]
MKKIPMPHGHHQIGGRGRRFRTYMSRYWTLYAMLALPLAYFTIFKYVPMTYIQIAFKKYSIVLSPWKMSLADNKGWQYFIQAFQNRDFLYALRNTVMLNLLDLVIGFPAPIIFALILNEMPFRRLKRFTQTVAYMPHFLSWIIIAGLALQLFAPNTGLVNVWLGKIGIGPIPFLNESKSWVATYILLGVWQSVGWNSIIYLAAITGINPTLYEAADIDGAGRMQKIRYITIPGIMNTIVVLLILNLGRILGSEFDRPFALRNALVNNVSNVISTFVYSAGIRGLQFSLTTAVGLFQSFVCVIFLLLSDAAAKRSGERGIV